MSLFDHNGEGLVGVENNGMRRSGVVRRGPGVGCVVFSAKSGEREQSKHSELGAVAKAGNAGSGKWLSRRNQIFSSLLELGFGCLSSGRQLLSLQAIVSHEFAKVENVQLVRLRHFNGPAFLQLW